MAQNSPPPSGYGLDDREPANSPAERTRRTKSACRETPSLACIRLTCVRTDSSTLLISYAATGNQRNWPWTPCSHNVRTCRKGIARKRNRGNAPEQGTRCRWSTGRSGCLRRLPAFRNQREEQQSAASTRPLGAAGLLVVAAAQRLSGPFFSQSKPAILSPVWETSPLSTLHSG